MEGGVVASLSSVVDTLHEAAAENRFIFWNTILALVPLVLALLVFRDGVRRGVWWWVGIAAWLLFLPNAPYVLTDSVHLLDDIRDASNGTVFFGLLPAYGAFFTVGFLSYVLSLRLARRHVVARGRARAWLPIEIALHGSCAVGMYLGRFVGLNSWDAVVAPSSVTGTLDDLARRFPLAVILVTFVVLVVGTFVVNAVLDASAHSVTRVLRRVRGS